MALSKLSEVISSKIFNASAIDDAWSDDTKSDEVLKPFCGIFVNLVVKGKGPSDDLHHSPQSFWYMPRNAQPANLGSHPAI